MRSLAEAESPTNAVEVLSPARVNAWVTVMETNHPALRAAQARARSADWNAQGIRRLADPKVLLGGTVYSSKGNNPADEGNLIYGIEQPLPVFGKEAAAQSVATADAATEAARATARFQELRRDLAQALFQAALARRVVLVAREDQAWLAEIVRTLEARFSTGNATQVEVLRAQTELARRAVEVENLQSKEAEALGAVNRRLGRDPLAPLPGFDLPGLAEPVTYSERLVRLAINAEPRLRVLATERRAAEAVVEATRRSQRPDLALGVDGRQYSGDGGFREGTFGLSINFPWWNRAKYRRDLARDRERLRAVEDEHADSALGLHEEVHHLTLEIAAARREALLFQDDLRPRTERTFSVALALWSSGRGELRDVFESRRLLLDTQVQFARAVAAQWTALAELVLCCGLADLEALEMLGRETAEPTPSNTNSSQRL
ncbi:MAG TPA: TolC family protein [Verrucomicrobiota bacterium]|nr:TolC family protein [Verrucomicrobiota bacterium]